MKEYRILTINPGSTSTKVAFFEGDRIVFRQTVQHDAAALSQFSSVSQQKAFRTEAVTNSLTAAGVELTGLDAVVGRGGGLLPVEGGTYLISDQLLAHAIAGANGVQHPAQLGPQIAREIADAYQVPAFVVNPPDVDELQDVARITGIRGISRTVHLHALNLKETAIRHAASLGGCYQDYRLIVCHLGGGISVSAHCGGRMIDGFDISGGDGPMAPTRCGAVSVANLLQYVQDHGLDAAKLLCTKTGGFVSHLGTSDAKEVQDRAKRGDLEAQKLWDALIYQIGKCIGSMAVVLNGQVDGILLGGGIACSSELVQRLKDTCDWIAPITAYPGEFELEAMAAGAIRVLDGTEPVKQYSGAGLYVLDKH